MKLCILLWLVAFVSHTMADPEDAIKELIDMIKKQEAERQLPGIRPPFNGMAQRIDVSGNHAFRPPGPRDQRGPCPGLNALANHNYLPRNGVATMLEYIHATNKIFGMGPDLAAILSILGLVFTGNFLSFSMGGPTDDVGFGGLGVLLSRPQGLSFSHNRYEGDGSCTRGDLYQYGNAARLQLSQFKALYAKQNGTDANYDLKIMNAFCQERDAQSIRENPYYFQGPISGFLVSRGAYQFVYRFMSNKSAEHPEGILNQEVLKSFYAVSGSDINNLTYLPGHERIPDNWYKRAIGDEYTVPYFAADMVKLYVTHPSLFKIGGNTGTTNSFVGVDFLDLTGGVFNGVTLLQGNNLHCYLYQILENAIPDAIKSILTLLFSAINPIFNPLLNSNGLLGCPQFSQFNSSLFVNYPGYTELLPDGTYNGVHQLARALWPHRNTS